MVVMLDIFYRIVKNCTWYYKCISHKKCTNTYYIFFSFSIILYEKLMSYSLPTCTVLDDFIYMMPVAKIVI